MTMTVLLRVAMTMGGDSIRIAAARRNERLINEGRVGELALMVECKQRNEWKENR
jgi:hypothetical protein